MRLQDIDTINNLAAEWGRLNNSIKTFESDLYSIKMTVSSKSGAAVTEHAYSNGYGSGIDIDRLRHAIYHALVAERNELQTKLALYGIVDFQPTGAA